MPWNPEAASGCRAVQSNDDDDAVFMVSYDAVRNESPTYLNTTAMTTNVSYAQFVDLNRDGRLDLVVCSWAHATYGAWCPIVCDRGKNKRVCLPVPGR